MDHGDEAAGADDGARGAKERDGFFGMKDIEEEGGVARGGREAEAVEEDVADGGADVGEAGGLGAGGGEATIAGSRSRAWTVARMRCASGIVNVP